MGTTMVKKGDPIAAPPQWSMLEDNALPQQRLSLFLALKQSNMEALEKYAHMVADPKSIVYGKHLTLEKLTSMVGASVETITIVRSWLHEAGLVDHKVRDSLGFITVNTTVQEAEKAFSCNMRRFIHTPSGKTVVRCVDSYFLPDHVVNHIDFVGPVHGFPAIRKKKFEKVVAETVGNAGKKMSVTPSVLRELYNVTVGSPNYSPINYTQAVLEIQDNYATSDLQKFLKSYAPELEGQKIVKDLGDSENNPKKFGSGEAALDVQYIMAMGSYAPTYYYKYKEDDVFKAFLLWTITLADDPSPPLVHSISYGEYGGSYPIDVVRRISDEWMKLGVRGLSLLFASGDDGVGCDGPCTAFSFPYPSSPWITLVGATTLYNTDSSKQERGWPQSSGGFSGDFARPQYQQDFVDYYLNNAPDLPPASFFNSTGRALPDISATGDDVMIFYANSKTPIAGTSCAAPIVSGLISLMNAERMKDGKSPLGFLNPVLYAAARMDSTTFNDITEGNNASGCCYGFSAYKGWDPVTGLGTPNFGKLLEYVKQLP